MNDIHHVVPRLTSPMLLLLSAWARCDGFPVGGSIDGAFGGFNEVVYIVAIVAGRLREWLDRVCPTALQPRLDGVTLEPDEAMNATAGNLPL